MRVRHLVSEKKELTKDSGWQINDLTPRHAPLFPKTTPIRSGWKWRSANVTGTNGEYILLVKCNPRRDNWQAILMKLILNDTMSASAVGRFEHHGSHPGLHIHTDCQRSGIEPGTPSLDDLLRIPNVASNHRRANAWTENGFWEAAKRFFRVKDKTGSLL
jgi:hypothetical protein